MAYWCHTATGISVIIGSDNGFCLTPSSHHLKSFNVKIPSANDKRQHKHPIKANEEWTVFRKIFFRVNEKKIKSYPNGHNCENMIIARKQYESLSVKFPRKHYFKKTEKLLNARIKM